MKKFSKFKCTYELGQNIFKVSITSADVNHIQVQVQSKFKCDDLVNQIQVQSRFKCDNLVNQVKYNQGSSVMTLSIKCQYSNDHYQLLV